MPDLSVPAGAQTVVWRIFGAGASPVNRRSSYELVEPIVRKHISPADRERTIAVIRGWFEAHADRRRLKPDLCEQVAVVILEGIRTERSETAVWAAGSVDAERAARIIRSGWSPDETDSLVEAALAMLEKLCDRDEVLDAAWIFPEIDAANARIPKDAVVRDGRLETYQHLDRHGFELVWTGIRPAAGTLIDLMLALRPGQFKSLVERLDHPVMQARAAERMLCGALPSDHRATLHWITGESCDALVALAILHTLKTVNRLDDEPRSAERAGPDLYEWSTELRPPHDDLDAAATDLLTGLVDRLAGLDPLACARWAGELLSGASYVLHGRGVGDSGKPRRIDQLERACTELLAGLARQSWSDDLLAAFRAGLCLTPRTTWTRHLADVAWTVREAAPALAADIARATLEEHERRVAKALQDNGLYLNWSDWHDREWIGGLGIALALSREEIDLPHWVSSRCRTLPLSVWDAEEDYGAFSAAEKVVRHWFLIALHALPALRALGRTIDPAVVRTLAVELWEHCGFARRYLYEPPEASIAAGYAARIVAEFGEPSDIWFLDQARHPGVGPRALWVFSDERRQKGLRERRTGVHHDEMIDAELIRIASTRFDEETHFNLDTLQFWGRLWLLLGAPDEAGRTAMAIITFSRRTRDRTMDILTLKLIALASCAGKPIQALTDYFALRYHQLWPGYTPSGERADRQEVDDLLDRAEAEDLRDG